MTTVQQMWMEHRALLVPSGAGELQVHLTKMAFVSGIGVVLAVLLELDRDKQFEAGAKLLLETHELISKLRKN